MMLPMQLFKLQIFLAMCRSPCLFLLPNSSRIFHFLVWYRVIMLFNL